MLTANQIPDYTGSAATDVTEWWVGMIQLGFNINPDDDPASCIDVDTGLQSFDASACEKIQKIYSAMFAQHGDDVYELAQTAFMLWMNYEKNTEALAGSNEDYWIKKND